MIKAFLLNLPFIRDIYKWKNLFCRNRPGHYYSPIPSHKDVLNYLESREGKTFELPDIQLNSEHQFQLLKKYEQFYKELPFPEKQNSTCRYYYDQGWFCYADAIFLYSFLRENKPKRIVEVGSGFSSAVIIDTVERFFSHPPEVTFIEPNPNRLEKILRRGDKYNFQIIETKVQEAPTEVFKLLTKGDLLFIDSSHVVKCGSDVQFLFFDVIPQLPSGIFVHFHDIFYPFEYPHKWLVEGRYWNENYFVRAFLSYNSAWRIYFFNTFISSAFSDYISKNMPLCLKNPGGSLYLEKI